MSKTDLFSEIVSQGLVDEMLMMLCEYSIREKNEIDEENRSRKASLKAIRKISNTTGDLEAIKDLSEE